MKKYLLKSLMLSAFLLMLTGSAYATSTWEHPLGWNGGDYGRDKRCNVPEPASIALLSSGMAGIGLINLIRRKKLQRETKHS